MNCGAMLEMILEADPTELAGRGDSVLARHLRECGRCRAVAWQILADTRRLELAIGATGASSSPSIEVGAHRGSGARRRLVATVLAAAVTGIAVLRGGGDAVEQTGSSPVARPVVARDPDQTIRETPRALGDVMTFKRVASPRAVALDAARRVVAVPVDAAAFPKAAAVAPARFAVPSAEEGTRVRAAGVAVVDPALGKRVAILRASDPTVTVYWLY